MVLFHIRAHTHTQVDTRTTREQTGGQTDRSRQAVVEHAQAAAAATSRRITLSQKRERELIELLARCTHSRTECSSNRKERRGGSSSTALRQSTSCDSTGAQAASLVGGYDGRGGSGETRARGDDERAAAARAKARAKASTTNVCVCVQRALVAFGDL